MCEHERHHHGRDCGCEEGGHGQHHGGNEQDCGCGGMGFRPGMRFVRRFPTRAERIARLEEYLKDLQAEAKAVEERVAELKAMG